MGCGSMESRKDDSYFIARIRENLAFIERNMSGVERQDFSANEVLQDSMLFRLIQISENAKKLSDEFRNKHAGIPWFEMYGLRNRIVHDYGNVDLGIIFSTLKDDIPELLLLINESLRK